MARGKIRRVAILGLGAMGRRHARVFRDLPDRYVLSGIYDPASEARGFARANGVRVFARSDHAIAEADLVVVASPIVTHARVVHAALEAGRDVLVEKPISATAAEANALVAFAARQTASLFVGHSERFNPAIRALRRLLVPERVLSIECRRVGPPSMRQREVGVLLNLGVHDLDLIGHLAGMPVSLEQALGHATPLGEDRAHVLVSTASGAAGYVYVDATSAVRQRLLGVTTNSWVYDADLLAQRLVRTSRTTGTRSEIPLVIEEPLVGQAIALADALDSGVNREVATGACGARAVSLAEEASAQLRSRAVLGLDAPAG